MPASVQGNQSSIIGRLWFGWLMICLCLITGQRAFSGSPSAFSLKQQSRADAGRNLFNGKGACYYCHGVDGLRDKMPQLESDTAALIARLNPPPADLRNPKTLKLKTDKARAKLIREGHEGTGMFPDPTLRDQELADLLAYLTRIRREGNQLHREGRIP